ncbi:MAG: hypothetical protein KU38_12250 [Sulfurovum sp. FS08-3]|nr:MAG: hypothetical protein KU38_12250 [Sulfurovum sp. FS08-3]
MKQRKLRIGFHSAVAILISYLLRKARVQLQTILPILFLMSVFQFFVIQYPLHERFSTILYLALLVPAMIFLLEGVKLGLMPVVEEVSATLVKENRTTPFIGSIFIFGLTIVMFEHYKYLSTILSNSYILLLALTVSLITLYGMLRFLFHMSFRKIIQKLFIIILLLSVIIEFTINDVHLAYSLDSVNIIINPIVYAMLLSFGHGVTRVTLNSVHINRSGFGTITIISLSVLIFTQLYIIVFSTFVSIQEIEPLSSVANTLDFIYSVEINVFMVVAYILYVLFLQFVVIKKPLMHNRDMLIGLIFVIFGTFLLFLGLKNGLAILARDVFFFLPSLISQIDIYTQDITIGYGPLYSKGTGDVIIVLFLYFLGYSATIAEPGLSIIASHTSNVSIGSFKKNLFTHIVAIGVGAGAAMGALKFIYDLNYFTLIIMPLLVIIVLLPRIDRRVLAIGMDYATVAVGPISIILIASLMQGFQIKTDNPTFLGVLALCWMYGYSSVLIFSYFSNRGKYE